MKGTSGISAMRSARDLSAYFFAKAFEAFSRAPPLQQAFHSNTRRRSSSSRASDMTWAARWK